MANGTTTGEGKWRFERSEDNLRWWLREDLYTTRARTPLSASTHNEFWDESSLCIADDLSFPDTRGFSVRTVNGYTYLSPIPITDPKVIEGRVPRFFSRLAELQANVDEDLVRCHEEQDRELAYWRSLDLQKTSSMDLLENWRRIMLTLYRFWKLHFLIVFPRHATTGMLDQAARELAGLESGADIGKLTQSMGRTRQLELDIELWHLAGRAIETGLKDTFLETMEEQLMPALASSDAGRAWLAELDRFLGIYGARAAGTMELHEPAWDEDPPPVLGTVRSYIAQGGYFDFDRLQNDRTVERDEMTQATLARIADEEGRQRFLSLLVPARKFQAAMEDDNYYFLWAGVQARRVAKEIGRRLAAVEALDDPDDVFFLNKHEVDRALFDAVAGIYDMSSVAQLARGRRAEWVEQLRAQPPPYLGDPPEEIHDFMMNNFWGIYTRKQMEEASSNVLTGYPASGGVVEGVACLLIDPGDFGKIEPGQVLVCRSTNPAWTPVFSKISAVVTDQGGTLAHAAIVAREYGIPAVVGTLHGTRRIPHGARVRVDGNAGKVEIL